MRKLFFILLLFIPFVSYSQNKLNFNVDYAIFKYDSVNCYIEFYYSCSQSQLQPVPDDSLFIVQALLHLEIKDSASNKNIVSKDWKIYNKLKDTSSVKRSSSLVGVISFIIPPGKYICHVKGSDDHNPDIFNNYSFALDIKNFSDTSITASNIQLASNIKQDAVNKKSIFYKNTLEVIPNPSGIFGENTPMLFYYAELYNLDKVENVKKLKVETFVLNKNRRKIYQRNKIVPTGIPSRVDVGAINISKFITGKYLLVITVLDSLNNYGVATSKDFFVYNPSVKDTTIKLTPEDSLYAGKFKSLSEDECDSIMEISRYASKKGELEAYSKLNGLDQKQNYLYNFWKVRDDKPATPLNEVYAEYMSRVEYSNDKFTSGGRAGWKSDRGRVYILYGEPSEIERYPNQVDTKPYEIWRYNDLQGGVIFVFADLTGFSDYRLLHSTMRGELRDDSWMQRVKSF